MDVTRTPALITRPGWASSDSRSSASAGLGSLSASMPVRLPSGTIVSGPAKAPRSRMNPQGSTDTLSR